MRNGLGKHSSTRNSVGRRKSVYEKATKLLLLLVSAGTLTDNQVYQLNSYVTQIAPMLHSSRQLMGIGRYCAGESRYETRKL